MNIFGKATCVFAIAVIAFCIVTLWNAGAFACEYASDQTDQQSVVDWTPNAEAGDHLIPELSPMEHAIERAIDEALFGSTNQ